MRPKANWYSVMSHPEASSEDPDAKAYLDAVSETDPVIRSAVNNWFLYNKLNSLHNDIVSAHIFLGSSATTAKFNAINPLDTDAAHRYIFAGGWSFNPQGAQPNGINGYANMKVNPLTHLGNIVAGVSLIVGNNVTGGYDIGCDDNSSLLSKPVSFITRYAGNVKSFFTWGNASYATNLASADSSGRWHGIYEAGTSKMYKSTTLLASTVEASTMPSRDLYLGAINGDGTPFYYANKLYKFVATHKIPSAKLALWDAGIAQLMTDLSR